MNICRGCIKLLIGKYEIAVCTWITAKNGGVASRKRRWVWWPIFIQWKAGRPWAWVFICFGCCVYKAQPRGAWTSPVLGSATATLTMKLQGLLGVALSLLVSQTVSTTTEFHQPVQKYLTSETLFCANEWSRVSLPSLNADTGVQGECIWNPALSFCFKPAEVFAIKLGQHFPIFVHFLFRRLCLPRGAGRDCEQA